MSLFTLNFAFQYATALRFCRQTMGALEELLPDEIRTATLRPGNELVLPYAEAVRVIGIATEHQIVVLGFEAFRVEVDGLQTVDYSGYDRDVSFIGNWPAYVAANNLAAERWIASHRYGVGHAYILTSVSEAEFAENTLRFGSPKQLADPAIAELLKRFRGAS
jgi:hypothetical protein